VARFCGKGLKSRSVWSEYFRWVDLQTETFIRSATRVLVEMRSGCAEEMVSVQRAGYLDAWRTAEMMQVDGDCVCNINPRVHA
jgi:hypothetical protein